MKRIVPAVIILNVIWPAAYPGYLEIETVISRAVVYEDRAMVTRTGKVKVPAGASEVTVTGLPPILIDDSVRVSGRSTGAVTITGTEIRKAFLTDPRRKEVEDLIRKIEALKDEKASLDDSLESLGLQKKFVASIQAAVPEEISREMLLSTPDPAAWGPVVEFVGESSLKILARQREVEREKRELGKKLKALEKELSQIKSFVSKEAKDIAVSVEAALPSELRLELSYVIWAATWRPVYDARADHDGGTVGLTYRAKVRQKTGEDWNDVKLALSTARPSIGGRPGELSPWYVGIYQPPARGRMVAYSVSKAVPAAPMEMVMGEEARLEEADDFEMKFDRAEIARTGAAVTFEIPRRQDIPTDGAFHGMAVDEMNIPAEFSYIATPKLAEYAYLLARCTNKADYPLLAGKINLFLGQDFVGTSQLETVAPGSKYDLYLGIDEDIKVERELVKESTEKGGLFRGKTGYKQYSYRIVLENFRKSPEQITVFDQIPVSQSPEITVELDRAVPPTVTITEKEQPGILSWKLHLPPSAKKTIEFEFTVEYPRDKELSGL